MDSIMKLDEYGVLGIVCIALIIAVGVLWRSYVSAQNARIDDSKFYNEKLFQLARDMDNTLNALKTVVEGIRRV